MRSLKVRRRPLLVVGAAVLLAGTGTLAYAATVPNPDPCDGAYRNNLTGERDYLDCRWDRIEQGLGKTVPNPDPCDASFANSYKGLRNYADCRLDRIERAVPTPTGPPTSSTSTSPTSTVTSTTITTSTTSTTTAPSRVVVTDFGAVGNGTTDSSTEIQAALNSGAQVVTLGPTGTFRASVTVPANVTFESDGATMIPRGGDTAVASSGGVNAVIRNMSINTAGVAGHHTILLAHSGSKVSQVTITGDAYRYGVLIENQGATLNGVVVEHSSFSNTSYAVLRQLTNLTSARITGNTFRNIHRGDAIELNVGNDVDVQVTGNDIDGVYMDGTGYGGIGLGIAGEGEYGQPLLAHGYLVSGNTVKNSESENIHFEKVRDSEVTGNTTAQTGTRSGVGIVHYGCTGMNVHDNIIDNVNIAQWEGWGVINSTWIQPPPGNPNLWTNNTVTNSNTTYLHTP